MAAMKAVDAAMRLIMNKPRGGFYSGWGWRLGAGGSRLGARGSGSGSGSGLRPLPIALEPNARNDREVGGVLPGGMKLIAETWVPAGRDEVFPFFAQAGNLQRLTPPWLHFAIRTPEPIAMARGTRI